MKNITTLFLAFALASSLAAQTNTMQFDQARSDSVFVDVGGGVKTSTFNVAGRYQSLVFLLIIQGGNPVVEFVSPQGTVLGLDSDQLSVQRLDWGVMAGLKTPELGLWTIRLSQTLGEGSYQVRTIAVPAVPTISLQTPSFPQEPWSTPKTVSGTTQPDQAGKTVRFVISDVANPQTTLTTAETTVRADGSFSTALDPSDIPMGVYSVQASLDQGDGNPAVNDLAPGTLSRPELPPLGPVTSLLTLVEQPDALVVSFEGNYGRRPATFHIHVQPTGGADQVIDLGLQTHARLTGFAAGDAQVWVTGIDSLGREGSPSAVHSATFGVPAPVAPNLVLNSSTAQVTMDGTQASVGYSLAGFFPPQDASVSYLQVTIGELPAGLYLTTTKPTWYLPTDATHLDFAVATDSTLLPGTYTIPLLFSIVGLPASSVPASLVVVQPVRAPSISAISPAQWVQGHDPVIEISGKNFGLGTRVFFDGDELPLVSYSDTRLTVNSPVTLSGGSHIVSVDTAGLQASSSVQVLTPNYVILAYKTVSKVQPGGTARYWLGVQGLNGFTGAATFQVPSLPPGWTVDVSPAVVTPGVDLVISVHVPAGTPAGDTDLGVTTSEGGQASLRVTVTTTAPDPFASSFSTYAELVGGSFAIRGYGFGSVPGTVMVDDQIWNTTAWSDDQITLVVPAGAKTGLLRVKTSTGRLTNGITFGVKDYGFQFHTNQLEYKVQGGETKSIDFQLTGYPQEVQLTAQSGNASLALTLDRPALTPLGIAHLSVAVDKNIAVGQYPITLSGTSGLFQTSITLNLRVGAALEWENQALPAGLVSTAYAVRLSAKNADGAVSFSIADGVLPPGLTLVGSEIRGRPVESGAYRVVLSAADTGGHQITKEFSIKVEETGWMRAGKDESRSYASPVDAPADQRTAWVSESTGSPYQLLATGGNIYAASSDHLQALFADKGTFLYRLDVAAQNWQIQQDRLFTLDAQGVLGAWDDAFGVKAWERPDVTGFWVKPGIVLAQSGDQVLVIDAGLGTLMQTVTADLSGVLVGWKGDLYRLSASRLERWNDSTGWQTQYTDPADANLTLAQGDGTLLLVQNSSGAVVSWDGQNVHNLWSGVVRHLVVGADWLVVDTGANLQLRNRADGSLMRTLGGGGFDELLAGRSKIFGVKQGVLFALNSYTGAEIWRDGATSPVLSGDRLYAVNTAGRVVAYNAPDNLKAPTTQLTAIPAANAATGWYNTQPVVSLSATDLETYAALTEWKLDAADWQPAGTKVLGEGSHSLTWRSTDTGGLLEADNFANPKVDSIAPATTVMVTGTAVTGLASVYSSAVMMTLSAFDATSGVAAIRYRVDGGTWQDYGAPVSFSTQKRYAVDVQARDLAGNLETVQTKAFWIDQQDPTVTAQVQDGKQSEFVYLSASDAGTGVDRIEYQIDAAATAVYQDVIAFTSTGQWTVKYRAVDRAGRSSGWQSLVVKNQGPAADANIDKITYDKALNGRDVVTNLKTSTELFVGGKDKFASVPALVAGAAYLRGKDTDSQSTSAAWITIKASGPTVVTYFKEPASQAVLTGWTSAGTIAAGTLSTKYFAQGHQAFTKTLSTGDTLVLAGPKLKTTGGDLVFVQALWDGLVVVGPAPGTELTPGQSVQLTAYPTSTTAVTWSLDDPKAILGTGNPFTWTVPTTLEGQTIVIRAATASGFQDQQNYKVLRQEKLLIHYPKTRDPIRTTGTLTPLASVRPASGKTVPTTNVIWTLTLAGKVVYQGAAPIPVTQSGSYHLKGETVGSRGQSLVAEVDFTAKAEAIWTKWKWKDHKLGPWDDDEGEGIDGTELPALESKEARFGSVKKLVDLWTWKKDSEYRQEVPNGTYDIKIVVGPLAAWDVKTLSVGINMLNLSAKQDGQMLVIQGRVAITDNNLRIRGTAGLGLYSIAFEPSDNPPTALTSTNLDDVGGLE